MARAGVRLGGALAALAAAAVVAWLWGAGGDGERDPVAHRTPGRAAVEETQRQAEPRPAATAEEGAAVAEAPKDVSEPDSAPTMAGEAHAKDEPAHETKAPDALVPVLPPAADVGVRLEAGPAPAAGGTPVEAFEPQEPHGERPEAQRTPEPDMPASGDARADAAAALPHDALQAGTEAAQRENDSRLSDRDQGRPPSAEETPAPDAEPVTAWEARRQDNGVLPQAAATPVAPQPVETQAEGAGAQEARNGSLEASDEALQSDARAWPLAERPDEPLAPEEGEAEHGLASGPSFGIDVVRADARGGVLVAGHAEPGAEIVVRLDELEIARAIADEAGEFVALFNSAPSERPQVLSFAIGGENGFHEAPEVIVLAPRLSTERVASAEPLPEDSSPPAPPPIASSPEQESGGEERGPVASAVAVAEAGHETAERSEAEAQAEEPTPAALGETRSEPAARTALAQTDARDTPPALAQATEAQAAGQEPTARHEEAAVSSAADAEREAQARAEAPAAEAVEQGALPEGRASQVTASQDHVLQAPASQPPAPLPPEQENAPLPGPTPPPALAEPPVAFAVDQAGGVRVFDESPAALESIVIDAIAYDDVGNVIVSGRTPPERPQSFLRLYLDNRAVAEEQAERGMWRFSLPEVAPGLYTLRVDELDADGRVLSRSETPFFREDAAALALREERPGEAAVPITHAPEAPGARAQAADAAQEPRVPSPPRARITLVTVQPGHTLWRISREHYGRGALYVRIYEANRAQIRNPHLIYPGQIFAIPD